MIRDDFLDIFINILKTMQYTIPKTNKYHLVKLHLTKVFSIYFCS